MQAGLHVPGTPFAQLTGAGAEVYSSRQIELASLWVQVVIACQGYFSHSCNGDLLTDVFGYPSIMLLGGYPPVTIACCSFEKTSWPLVPNLLKLRYKALEILSEAQSTIVELGLDVDLTGELSVLFARIKRLVTKLNLLEVELSEGV